MPHTKLVLSWIVAAATLMSVLSGCGRIPLTTATVGGTSGLKAKLHHRTQGAWVASPLVYESTPNVIINRDVQVPILMYHDMNYLRADNLGMAPNQFEDEMAFLYAQNFHTINFGQLYAALYKGYRLPTRPILLTFDDGYESVYTKAYPILRRYRFQGTVFMISGWIGLHGKYPMLNSRELLDMQNSGLIDVESHTAHHIDLDTPPNRVIQAELVGSAATLSKQLRHPILYFCFPSGRYRAQTLSDLKQDGYLLAVTERPGYANAVDGPYKLRRLRIYEGLSLAGFEAMLSKSVAVRVATVKS